MKVIFLTTINIFDIIYTLKGSSSQIICDINRQYIPLVGIGYILKNKTFIAGQSAPCNKSLFCLIGNYNKLYNVNYTICNKINNHIILTPIKQK